MVIYQAIILVCSRSQCSKDPKMLVQRICLDLQQFQHHLQKWMVDKQAFLFGKVQPARGRRCEFRVPKCWSLFLSTSFVCAMNSKRLAVWVIYKEIIIPNYFGISKQSTMTIIFYDNDPFIQPLSHGMEVFFRGICSNDPLSATFLARRLKRVSQNSFDLHERTNPAK